MQVRLLYEHQLVRLECHRLTDEFAYFLLTMQAGENRFDPPMNEQLYKCLALVEKDFVNILPTTKIALLLTGQDKYFSLGLDLESYYNESKRTTRAPQQIFHDSYSKVIVKLLTFPLMTVAVLNGHAIAGGMVLALACDFRVGRNQQGFMWMNEIYLPSSIPMAMLEVIKAKIGDPRLRRDILLLGRRYSSTEVHRLGVIDEITSTENESILELAISLAQKVSHTIKKGPFLHLIKECLYHETVHHLTNLESTDHFTFALKVNSKI